MPLSTWRTCTDKRIAAERGSELLDTNKMCASSRSAPRAAPTVYNALSAPLAGRLFVLGPVRLVDVRYLGYKRVVGVRVRQQRANGEKNL